MLASLLVARDHPSTPTLCVSVVTLLPQVPALIIELYTLSTLEDFTEIFSPPAAVPTVWVSICWRNQHGRAGEGLARSDQGTTRQRRFEQRPAKHLHRFKVNMPERAHTAQRYAQLCTSDAVPCRIAATTGDTLPKGTVGRTMFAAWNFSPVVDLAGPSHAGTFGILPQAFCPREIRDILSDTAEDAAAKRWGD